MNFSQALDAIKAGQRVRRDGWVDDGVWLALTSGSAISPAVANRGAAARLSMTERPGRATNPEPIIINPHIDQRVCDGSLMCGWTPSQIDLFAEDWEVVE